MKDNNKINGVHVYQGECPDVNNGPYSRDRNCPVCQALMAMEKQPASNETHAVETKGATMVNYCLRCQKQVGPGAEYPDNKDGINPNYEGMRIHFGPDWYCGPVIELNKCNIPVTELYEIVTQEVNQ